MIRNNSDPAPPPTPQPGQPRVVGYRSSMQELRREPTQCGPEPGTPGRQTQRRTGLERPAAVALAVGQGGNVGMPGPAGSIGQMGVVGQTVSVGQGVCLCQTENVGQTSVGGVVGEMGVASRGCSAAQTAPAGRGSPTMSHRGTASREVGISRGWGIPGEEGRTGGDAPGSRGAEPGGPSERPRELLVTREPVDCRETSEAAVTAPAPDRRLKLSKPVRLVCPEAERDSARDSEV